MRFPDCSGNGTVPIRDENGKRVGVTYCNRCSGWGVVHCCEGDSACNDAEDHHGFAPLREMLMQAHVELTGIMAQIPVTGSVG